MRWSGDASENGPGWSGSARSPTGTTRASAAPGTRIQSLRSRPCQHTNPSRPRGVSAPRRFSNAARGSAKNITPKRLMITSKRAPNAAVCASATSKRTFAHPAAAARARARASMTGDRSTPSTDAACRPAWSAVVPVPQPTSRTESRAVRPTASSSAAPYPSS